MISACCLNSFISLIWFMSLTIQVPWVMIFESRELLSWIFVVVGCRRSAYFFSFTCRTTSAFMNIHRHNFFIIFYWVTRKYNFQLFRYFSLIFRLWSRIQWIWIDIQLEGCTPHLHTLDRSHSFTWLEEVSMIVLTVWHKLVYTNKIKNSSEWRMSFFTYIKLNASRHSWFWLIRGKSCD